MPIPPGWDVARAAELNRAGWSLRQLAAEFGREASVIRRQLVKQGVVMRPAVLPKSGPPTERLLELRKAGLTHLQIAAEVGMIESGARARLRDHGLLTVYEAAPIDAACARCDESIAAGEQVGRVPGLDGWGWARASCLPEVTSRSP